MDQATVMKLGGVGLTAEKTDKPAARSRLARKGDKAGSEAGPVSNALRSAYEEAVKEDVPAEFLDLLGKLS